MAELQGELAALEARLIDIERELAEAGAPEPDGQRITVDAGPFPDAASLAAFERGLDGLGEVARARAVALRDERARLDVRLAPDAGELVEAMRRELDFRFAVVGSQDDRLTLAVDARPHSLS